MNKTPSANPIQGQDQKPRQMTSQHITMTWRNFFSYFSSALIWAVVVYFLARQFAVNNFWSVVVSVFLLSLPIGLAGIYSTTIRQIQRFTIFKEKGWFYRVFFGRSLKILFWICWALASSFFMLIQFHIYNQLEWLVFFLIIPVFWACFILLKKLFFREFKTYVLTNMALIWARRLSPLLMLIIYVVLTGYFKDTLNYHSLQDAIATQKSALADMNRSALVREASQYLAFYNGTRAYALGRLGELNSLWGLALLGMGGYVIFYNACAMLSCFLIPRVEYRRLLNPAADDKPAPVPLSRLASFVAVFTFIALFIYLPLLTYMEFWVKHTGAINTHATETQLIQKLEQIDNDYFREGTLEQLQTARIESLHKVDISLIQLDAQVDRAFDRLETNVDGFLDWYYSLTGEYARIAYMMTGELEDYMSEKLEQYLQQGDTFKEVQAALNNALETHHTAQQEYLQQAQIIMTRNRVIPQDTPVHIVQGISLDNVLNPPIHQDVISMQQKLGSAAVSGLLTAVVVKKIIGKILGKNVLKLAAKALTKALFSKTAGTAGGAGSGALAGAAIGSALPGLGTAVGAVIGAIIAGVAVGVAVDKTLIEVEEYLNREEFKHELLASIQEARTEFKAELSSKK